MDRLRVDLEIFNLNDGRRRILVPHLQVDEDQSYTWIDSGTLKKIGIPEVKQVRFVNDKGHFVTRAIGFAELHVGSYFTVDEIVFAEADDFHVVGARALWGFGVWLDPYKGRLDDVIRRVSQPLPRKE